MKYKILGNSGLKVSELCLGTMTFGTEWGPMGNSMEESKKVFDEFVANGGNFIDTANKYMEGTSEKWLGEFMGKERDKFVIATKYTLAMDPDDPNSCGNHRKNLFVSVRDSLKRLNTEYIDLLWVHAWDYFTPVDEVMRALDDLVRQGKIHHIGFSDGPAWVVAKANTLAKEKGWTPFCALQLQYSLINRGIERELVPLSKDMNLSILAWSPLAGGALTGKYLDGEQGRLAPDDPWGKEFLSDRSTKIVQEVARMAKELEKSPAQVALRWLIQKGIFPIVGARKESHIIDNLASSDFQLDDASMQKLNRISAIELGFPYDFVQNPMAKSLIYGNKEISN